MKGHEIVFVEGFKMMPVMWVPVVNECGGVTDYGILSLLIPLSFLESTKNQLWQNKSA